MAFRWTGGNLPQHGWRMMALWTLAAAMLGGSPASAGDIRDIRVEETRVVVRFDERVAQASSFALTGPDRIAIDVTGAQPGGDVRPNGPVSAIRQGRRGADGARIVLDLARPVVVTRGTLDRDGRTLTLDLSAVDARRFALASTAGRMRFGAPGVGAAIAAGTAQPTSARYRVAVPVPPKRRGVPLPEIRGNPDRPLVVIDAGHGGHDPGAISPHGGMREKDLTLKTARTIRDELLAGGRVRVALTRDSDTFLVLQERYGIARRLGASLFISVHCDSAENQGAAGASIYTLSEVASDREAARLAARENKADVLAGVDLGQQSADISSILIDLTQRETMNASAGFARLLGREATDLIPLRANYHRMASLMVLKAPDLPSILFETGYLSNVDDAARLDSADGRRAIARSVRRAVEVHFARRMASR